MPKADHTPFRIEGPTAISFSGGRTSAYLLRRVLDANGGQLPGDAQVVFANTGKERQETLDFVREVGDRWAVPITWVEFQEGPDRFSRFRVVDFWRAGRRGEPFERLVTWRGFVPNPVARICTQHLKVTAMHGYLRTVVGWDEWDSFIGIRHDEPRRWKIKGQDRRARFDTRVLPLVAAKVDVQQVLEFWDQQPFDLKLRTYEGNCDLCYLKGKRKIFRVIQENPHLAEWWAALEERTGNTFRVDRPTYRQMIAQVHAQPLLPIFQEAVGAGEIDDETIPCLCTD